MMLHSHQDYVANPFEATAPIGALLKAGRLALFLGAGVSKGFGLTSWKELIAKVCGKEKDAAFVASLATMNDTQMTELVDDHDDESVNYQKLVHASLYSNIHEELYDRFARAPLLLAIAALCTGSCRGRIQQVFTYNYDDLLQQYLGMLGYAVCTRISPTDYSSRADVEINHVHGSLPQHWNREEKICDLVLSAKSYRKRRATIDTGWPLGVVTSLYLKAGLFVGLSGDDQVILDAMKRAQLNIQRTDSYHGYWLLSPDAYARNHKKILDVRMCPISLEIDQFPEFIFKVCQKAT